MCAASFVGVIFLIWFVCALLNIGLMRLLDVLELGYQSKYSKDSWENYILWGPFATVALLVLLVVGLMFYLIILLGVVLFE